MGKRIFLAGAAGVVGRRLGPLLLEAGYSVWGTTRSDAKAEALGKLGITPVIIDVYDAQALSQAVLAARPEIVIHQLTDLPVTLDREKMNAASFGNARVRDEGTRNLVAAALAAGARRLVAQSIAWVYASGPLPHREEDPLDTGAEGARAVSVGGVIALERQVLQAPLEGVVLRYGYFYGPETGKDTRPDGAPVHVDAAAYAALLAVDRGRPGIYNVAEPNSQITTEKAVVELGWRADFRMPQR